MNSILISLGIHSKNTAAGIYIPSGTRTILANTAHFDPQNNTQNYKKRHFLSNQVSTGKYSTTTFLPKFIFEFFSSYANLFFLFTGAIQLIGDLSPTSKYGTAIPLTIVFLLQAVKEGSEDSKRHRMDTKVNQRVCQVMKNTFTPTQWSKIRVGDVVRISDKEYFPCDLIILSSSEPDALCYIETANLDGETNLKIRQGVLETSKLLTPESVSRLGILIKSELPNNSLYTFEATLEYEGKEVPISAQQLLLRGAQLRNTKWVYAIVVFTGHETKLLMNSTSTPIKKTKVIRIINTQILFLFAMLLIIAFSGAFGQLYTELNSAFIRDILLQSTTASTSYYPNFPKNVLTYIILFNNLIPLSLIVTIEIVKFRLGSFINDDLDMYYEESDCPAIARSTSLVEELGQVDYIFSDKTGTLTQNIMEFKKVSIAGTSYEINDLKAAVNTKTRADVDEFMTLLTVCHTVIPEYDQDNILSYQASSPDESALVDAAKALGYVFHTRRPKSLGIRVQGIEREYKILAINEFNSTRKRMSVLVRGPDNRIQLMIKGADSVIYDRLGGRCEFKDETLTHLESYALIGLRTLALAMRSISEDEYQRWMTRFTTANATINNRQQALDAVAEEIEVDLVLLGATAIEDKLQDGVPETIYTLMSAGIKLWVLTGDRQETAVNIGMSCRLIKPEMSIITLNERSLEDTRKLIQTNLDLINCEFGGRIHFKMGFWDRFWMGLSDRDGRFDKNIGEDLQPLALVIDGVTLEYALDSSVKEIFLELAMLCQAVIACRVSPLQKALVVKLVRDNVGGCVTLAIGDGANDVSMIQAAHVGVGISGQEGLQAARSADFAIGQFKFLRKLLLVHGGWAYSRITKVVVISFYKNITLYFIQFWYAMYNGWSAQTLFETWSSVSSYNVIWTLLPPFAIGVFDQYVSARILDKYPEMYRLGQSDSFYSHKIFLGYFFNAVLHSAALFFLWVYILGDGDILAEGRVADNWVFGTMVYASTLLTVIIKHFLVVSSFVSFIWYAFLGSIMAFVVFFPIYAIVGPALNFSPELFNINRQVGLSLTFWFALILVPLAVNVRDVAWKSYKRSFIPKQYHIAQEIMKYNVPDYRSSKWFARVAGKLKKVGWTKRPSMGYAFSQTYGQIDLLKKYDSTVRKPSGL